MGSPLVWLGWDRFLVLLFVKRRCCSYWRVREASASVIFVSPEGVEDFDRRVADRGFGALGARSCLGSALGVSVEQEYGIP
jgi:hypothetical protein